MMNRASLKLRLLRLKFFSPNKYFRIICLLSLIFNTTPTSSAQRPATTPTPDANCQQERGLSLTPDASPQKPALDASSDNTSRPELVVQTGHTFAVSHLLFSPDGRLIASNAFNDSAVKLWETATGRELRALAGPSGGASFYQSGVSALAFSRDGRMLAAAGYDNTIKLWDAASGRDLGALSASTASSGSLISAAGINSLTFSPDGRLLASTHGDRIRLWDVAAGQELRTLETASTSAGFGSALTFSPDGHEMAALVHTREGSTAKFYSVADDSMTREASLPGQTLYMSGNTLVFGSDGHLLIPLLQTSSRDKGEDRIEVWDATSKSKRREFSLGQETNSIVKAKANKDRQVVVNVSRGANSVVKLSADGRLLAASTGDAVNIWDIATGQKLQTLNILNNGLLPDRALLSLDWSADASLLATGGIDGQIKLWEVASGREVRDLVGHSNLAFNVAFNAEGTRLFSGDKTIWDVATGRGLRSIPALNSSYGFVSRDGRVLVSRNFSDRSIQVWNVAGGRLLHTLTPPAGFNPDISALSPDGRALALTYVRDLNDAQARSREEQQDETKRQTQYGQEAIKAMREAMKKNPGDVQAAQQAYLQQLDLAKADQVENQIKIFDVASGNEVRTLTGHSGNVRTVNFSSDGRRLVSGTQNGESKVWDVATGREVSSFGGQAAASTNANLYGMTAAFGGGKTDIAAVAFGSDQHLVASVGREQTYDNFDPTALLSAAQAQLNARRAPSGRGGILGGIGRRGGKGAPRASIPNVQDFYKQIKIKVIGPIKLWDAATGQLIKTLPGHDGGTVSVAFSNDGQLLATGGADATIKLWDVATGNEIRTLRGQTTQANSLAFSPDAQLLAAASNDGSTRLWDTHTGDMLATLVSLYDGGDWLVVTPDGLFDGSPGAWNQVLWRYSQETFNVAPIEWFFNEFYAPGLLADLVAGRRPKATQDISLKDRRQPQLKLALGDEAATTTNVAAAGATVSTRDLKVRLEVNEAPADRDHRTGSGARDVRLFRNGSLVKVWRGDVLQGRSSATLETMLPVVAGENRLTAYGFNRDNVKSKDATLLLTGNESLRRKGVAYILAIGVNRYANPQYDLKYAVADAQDFGAEVKRQQDKLRRYDRAEVISLLDKDATKANVLSALQNLATTQPEDEVIVYFAGHGTAQRNQFYLIPHDLGYAGSRTQLSAAGVQSILAHGISDKELEAAFESINAGQVVLVIDACNSGQALEAEEKRRGPMNSKGLAQLAYEKGMYILTAAQSFQAAQEASQVGHGLLTFALVEEGLKQGAADIDPPDGEVRVREWFDYAMTRVPQMQVEKMKQARDVGINLSFAEGEDARGLDVARRVAQSPRPFYRRELEAQPLVVAKPAQKK